MLSDDTQRHRLLRICIRILTARQLHPNPCTSCADRPCPPLLLQLLGSCEHCFVECGPLQEVPPVVTVINPAQPSPLGRSPLAPNTSPHLAAAATADSGAVPEDRIKQRVHFTHHARL